MVQVKNQTIITPSEWEVMRVVWPNQTVTSREIIEILADKMAWSESTIKTLISRLVDKQALKTRKVGRKYLYSPRINESDSTVDRVTQLLASVCDKHESQIAKQMLSAAQLSQTDIDELLTILKEKRATAPTVVACHCVAGQCDCHLMRER